MKLTVFPGSCGYSGQALAELMRAYRIECEYSDLSSIVFMPSPFNSEEDFQRLESAFAEIPHKAAASSPVQVFPVAKAAMSLRTAYFSDSEELSTDEAAGRICARSALSCQPSIPLITGGEIFTPEIINILKNYSIFTVNVVK